MVIPLSTIVANLLIALRQENYNGHPGVSYTGEWLNIEFKSSSLISNEPKLVKLYNIGKLPQKIELYLNVGLTTPFPNNSFHIHCIIFLHYS